MTTRGDDGAVRSVFFHCSATVAGQSLVPPSYPGMVEDFRRSFARLRSVKADIFLANHGNFFGLEEKSARLAAGDADAFVDPAELARFSAAMEKNFEEEYARQLKAAKP